MLLLTKTDQTKAKVVMFDENLNKKWETDIFLDVERSPTSYSFDKEHITFLFEKQEVCIIKFIFLTWLLANTKIKALRLESF